MFYNRFIPGTSKYGEARQKEILFKKSSLLKNNTKTKTKQQQKKKKRQLDGKKGSKILGIKESKRVIRSVNCPANPETRRYFLSELLN